MRLLTPVFLLALLGAIAPALSGAVTTTVALTGGQGRNKAITATINSTENILQLNLDDGQGRPRTMMLFSRDTDWIYRTTSGDTTTDVYVAKGQVLTLEYTTSTTAYFVRQSADGNLTLLPVK